MKAKDKKVKDTNGAKKKRNARGASRTAARQPRDSGAIVRNLWRVVLGLACVAVLVAGGYFAKVFVQSAAQRPVNSVHVAGRFSYLSKQDVADIIAPMISEGFVRVPLSAIKRELENNPWIEQAGVSRRWPDQLVVSVIEQQPIARWGSEGFLNYKGEAIAINDQSPLAGLPLLHGLPGQSKALMQHYQELNQLLRGYDLQIAEFYCDDLISWRVVLGNGLVITIGRDQVMEKVQRFLVVYQQSLHNQLARVAAVDLRYGNGVAVQWKSKDRDDDEKSGVQLAGLSESAR